MRRLGAAVLLMLAVATAGCRLFEREPVYAPQYYQPCQPCVPCQPCCVPTTAQCAPATARPVLSR